MGENIGEVVAATAHVDGPTRSRFAGPNSTAREAGLLCRMTRRGRLGEALL